MKKFMLPAFLVPAISAGARMKADDEKTFTLKNGMKFLVVMNGYDDIDFLQSQKKDIRVHAD